MQHPREPRTLSLYELTLCTITVVGTCTLPNDVVIIYTCISALLSHRPPPGARTPTARTEKKNDSSKQPIKFVPHGTELMSLFLLERSSCRIYCYPFFLLFVFCFVALLRTLELADLTGSRIMCDHFRIWKLRTSAVDTSLIL